MPGPNKDFILKETDHDTLITLVQILTSHVSNFDKHTASDEANFKELRSIVKNIERCVWFATGAIVVFHALPQIALLMKILKGA